MTARARVGFVGPGAMGLPMAHHLLRAGHRLTVHARRPGRVRSLSDAGARLAGTPAAVVAGSDVVIGCLLDDRAVTDIYLGPQGLLDAVGPGQILVEHGTVAPGLARDLAARAADKGAGFCDVPVTGGPGRARDGQLTGIAGGDVSHLEAVRPLLDLYCADVVHTGPTGSGLELKLVNQLLVSVHVAAAAEAAALIGRLGLPAGESKRALMSGWAASAMLDYSLPTALAPSQEPSGATLGGMVAVQSLVDDLARSHDVPLRVFPAVRALFSAAVRGGAGERDLAQLARTYDPRHPTAPARSATPHPEPGSAPAAPISGR